MDAEFVTLPPRRLKGLRDPIRLVHVKRRNPALLERSVDVVCGMLLLPGDVQARATWQGADYVFCSAMCRQAFTERPARYAETARPAARS